MVEPQDSETPELNGPSAETGVRASVSPGCQPNSSRMLAALVWPGGANS